MTVYTHLASADDERIAEQLGEFWTQLDKMQLRSKKEKGLPLRKPS
jgi:hypothetical protein